MKVAHSDHALIRARAANVSDALSQVSATYLRKVIDTVCVPRHAIAEPGANAKVAAWIKAELESFGYNTLAAPPPDERKGFAFPSSPSKTREATPPNSEQLKISGLRWA